MTTRTERGRDGKKAAKEFAKITTGDTKKLIKT